MITDLLQTLPDWLSAIGTLAAVIVALYLARRDKQIQCIANCSVYVWIDTGTKEPSECVTIIITNNGIRVFTVSGISWRTGIIKKKHFAQIPSPNTYSSSIPVELTDGKQATMNIPMDVFRNNVRQLLLKTAPKYFRDFWILFTRIIVHTTTGQTFTFGIHKSVRAEILANREKVK